MVINVLSHGLVYSSCSVTKRLSVHVPRKKHELINDHRDFITYFSRHFQFQDLRRMNKDYESANETIIVIITYTYLIWTSVLFFVHTS